MTDADLVGPPNDHIVETDIEGDISLYDPSTEQVMVLNATASDVWLLSDGEHTLPEMVELLAGAYGVKPDDIKEEVESTVASFIESGFIHDGGNG